MSTIEITRVEDIRPGDHVTLTCNDTTVSGTVRNATHADTTHFFDIANLPCDLIAGGGHWTFVSAYRVVPDLPTEPESVIVNATIRGETGHMAILDDGGVWFTPRVVGAGHWTHRPEHITYWEPARIVREDEQA